MGIYLALAFMDRCLILRRVWDDLLETLQRKTIRVSIFEGNGFVKKRGLTYKLLKDAIIQSILFPSALPQMLVILLQTLPVLPELL